MERSKAKLKLDNVPAPYYIEYRVTEIDQFEASAVFGAMRSQQRDRGRLLRVVVRVGDYKQDSYCRDGRRHGRSGADGRRRVRDATPHLAGHGSRLQICERSADGQASRLETIESR